MTIKTYQVLETSAVGDVLYKPGDIVAYDFGADPVGPNLREVTVSAAKTDEAIAAQAREFALNHPEAHVGLQVGGNQAMTHEQGAGLQALGSEATLTPAEVSAAEAEPAKPVKGK